jgi:hypothetical protein
MLRPFDASLVSTHLSTPSATHHHPVAQFSIIVAFKYHPEVNIMLKSVVLTISHV